jgi:hypothetical protein
MKEFIYDLIKDILKKIPDSNLNSKDSNESNQDGENEDDDEDDYFKKIDERRRMQSQNNKIANIVTQTVQNSKIKNKFGDNNKIRIYLLNTQHYYDFGISCSDSIRELKIKILSYLEKEQKFKLKYNIPEGK